MSKKITDNIEDIMGLVSELSALNTLVFDRLTSIYDLDKTARLYELDRMKSVFTPVYYMIDGKLSEVDTLSNEIERMIATRKGEVSE